MRRCPLCSRITSSKVPAPLLPAPGTSLRHSLCSSPVLSHLWRSLCSSLPHPGAHMLHPHILITLCVPSLTPHTLLCLPWASSPIFLASPRHPCASLCISHIPLVHPRVSFVLLLCPALCVHSLGIPFMFLLQHLCILVCPGASFTLVQPFSS